jgi:hypothetical protein
MKNKLNVNMSNKSKFFKINETEVEPIVSKYKSVIARKSDFSQDLNFFNDLLKIDVEILGKILEKCFSASLAKEEGLFHNFRVLILPKPENIDVEQEYVFEKAYEIENIHKLAPAFIPETWAMCIWFNEDKTPEIWGIKSSSEHCLQIFTLAEGKLIVHIPALNPPNSENPIVDVRKDIWVLTFNGVGFVKQETLNLANFFNGDYKKEKAKFLRSIVDRMRKHCHGGTLLIIPTDKKESILKESIKPDSPFKVETPFQYVKNNFLIAQKELAPEILNSSAQNKGNEYMRIRQIVESNWVGIDLLKQVTAVDGATIINSDLELIAFGAKIKPKEVENDSVGTIEPKNRIEVFVRKPFETSENVPKLISNLGGMRHQSATQFVYEQRESVAIVASQDGKLSVIYWDKEKEKVQIIEHAEYLFAQVY